MLAYFSCFACDFLIRTILINIFFLVEDCSIGFHFFEKVQDLPTRGAVDVEHFTIDGSLFLAFANYYGGIKKHKTGSMIYKMDNSTGRLSLYQTLQTRGAHGLEYFSIADKHFLAVANHYDGTYRVDSTVYQWNGKLFVDFQKLSTNGAIHITFFNVNGEHYLLVASFRDGSTHSTKSVIYKWSSGKFNRFQDISTEGARGCTAFEINGDTFIAFANHYSPQNKHSVESTVFKWSGGRFVKLQSLQTYGTYDVRSFNINGHKFLAFANFYSGSKHNTDSFIYKWNGNKFVLFQSIPTRGATGWYPFVIKTSSAFLEYRRFEARRAVVCSLSAYKELKLPGTSFTGRTLYTFYSRCKISASEARVFAESKFSIFWLKKPWHFCQFHLNPSSPSFSFFLSHFLVLGIFWASFPCFNNRSAISFYFYFIILPHGINYK